MNTQNLIANLEQGFKAASEIKGQLTERILVPLHANLEGFQDPTNFGVYKETGGPALGVVGKSYEPLNLNRFYDVIERSIIECGSNFDLSKMTYNEYFEGKKVSFDIPFKSDVLKSGMPGDVVDYKLQFKTGFDGNTKTSLNFYTYRQICSNGMMGWGRDLALSFKNTKGNAGKELLLCNEIFKAIEGVGAYTNKLNELATVKVTRGEIKAFVGKLTGYDVQNPSSTKQSNILDDLIASIELEMRTTGQTAFSLLQGVTRHTTHYKAKGDVSSIMYGTSNDMNQRAMQLVQAY